MFPLVRILRERDHFMEQRPGCNAYNGFFQVHILADLESSESWVGVLAQEVYEVRFKWANLLKWPFAGAALERELELRGHATECAAAALIDGLEGAALDAYIRLKAGALLQYDLGFTGTVDDLARQIGSRYFAQAAWVHNHEDDLRGYLAQRNAMRAT